VSPTLEPPNFITTRPGVRAARSTAGRASNWVTDILRRCRRMSVRRWVAPVFCLIGLGLLPWTLYLVRSLKPEHVTGSWDLAWSGFDTLLAVAFLLTATAAWRRSSWIEACAAATGTLLLCDAWFDVVLESRGTELRTALIEALAF